MGSPGVAMSLGRVGGRVGLAGKLSRRQLRSVHVGSNGGSGSSWARRAGAPEVGAQVGHLEKRSQELGKRLVAVERGCHG